MIKLNSINTRCEMVSILIHGLGQGASSWKETIGYLDENRSIYCVDLYSLVRTSEIDYRNLYQALVEYCNRFDEPIHICGLSLGGVLALNYAIDYPEKVNTLTLIGTQFKMPKVLLSIQHAIFYLLPKSTFENTGLDKRNFLNLSKSLTNLDFSHQLLEIKCPVMMICGEKDIVNKKASRHLHQHIKGSRLAIIENAGHEVNLDNPGKLAKVISGFWCTIH